MLHGNHFFFFLHLYLSSLSYNPFPSFAVSSSRAFHCPSSLRHGSLNAKSNILFSNVVVMVICVRHIYTKLTRRFGGASSKFECVCVRRLRRSLKASNARLFPFQFDLVSIRWCLPALPSFPFFFFHPLVSSSFHLCAFLLVPLSIAIGTATQFPLFAHMYNLQASL